MEFEKVLNESCSFYSLEDNERACYLSFVKSSIHGTDILEKMENIVEKHVKHYQTDFYVHDFIELTQNPEYSFIWIVRDKGTHLFFLKESVYDVESEKYSLSYFNTILEQYYSVIKGIYFGVSTNGTLQKITLKKAMEKLSGYKEKLIN